MQRVAIGGFSECVRRVALGGGRRGLRRRLLLMLLMMLLLLLLLRIGMWLRMRRRGSGLLGWAIPIIGWVHQASEIHFERMRNLARRVNGFKAQQAP